jgi:molecular chaperone DnaK
MGFALGIDVGTTFTAAAIWRDERVEVVSLESHRVAVPSVLFASGDDVVFGTAAVGRGATHPEAVAREFKRRLGDSVPILLSGAPYSADRIVALFAQWVVRTVAEQLGESPDRIVVTHPANWTEFQLHLLRTSLDQVGLGGAALLTEPQAAAIDFGAAARLEPGQLIIVYDLGGGTFDVALLRREQVGFAHVGEPAGIERLGGIDFDEAVFQHVIANVPEQVVAQARGDQAGRMALAQLRRACIEAKESLSSEVAVDVPVVLPGATSTVRLTRAEFEDMIRPMLNQTVELVRQVTTRAGITATDLAAVLLVGGSSRIPVVSELVREQLGAPVRVDAHPKLVVPRGAARWAGTLTPGRAPAIGATTGPSRSRRRAVLIGAGVALVAALGVGGWLVAARDDGGSAAPDDTDPAATVETVPQSVPATTAAAPETTASATTPTSAPDTTTAPTVPAGERVARLEFIGTAALAPGSTTPDGRTLGAFTGLTNDPRSGELVALSDTRIGDFEATLFDVDIDLSDGRLDDGDVTFGAATTLLDADGQPYGEELDGEALAMLDDGAVVVASEGAAADEHSSTVREPFLHEFDAQGQFVGEWPIPEWYSPDPSQATGIRPEGGLMSLTTAFGGQLIAAVEYTLYQDEESPGYDGEKFARLIAFDAATREPVAEYSYPLDPTGFERVGSDGRTVPSGLLDLVALDDGRAFIAAERSLREDPIRTSLYEVVLEADAAATPSTDRPAARLTKRRLTDVEVGGGFESIAFGPDLPDGRRTLILLADHGFDRTTPVAAYAITTEPAAG